MLLTSYERRLLASYILMSKEDQERTYREAKMNPQSSGPLLNAYREVLKLI